MSDIDRVPLNELTEAVTSGVLRAIESHLVTDDAGATLADYISKYGFFVSSQGGGIVTAGIFPYESFPNPFGLMTEQPET